MFDLKIDQNGDLTLVKNEVKGARVKVEFYLTTSKAIKVNFELEGFSSKHRGQVQVSFDIDNHQDIYKFETVNDLNGLKQACDIRIKTELGDMRNNQTIGSKMQSLIHQPLFNTFVIKSAEEAVKDALTDILPNAQISAEPKVIQSNKKYEQVMSFSIYDEDTLIAYHNAR